MCAYHKRRTRGNCVSSRRRVPFAELIIRFRCFFKKYRRSLKGISIARAFPYLPFGHDTYFGDTDFLFDITYLSLSLFLVRDEMLPSFRPDSNDRQLTWSFHVLANCDTIRPGNGRKEIVRRAFSRGRRWPLKTLAARAPNSLGSRNVIPRLMEPLCLSSRIQECVLTESRYFIVYPFFF